MTNNGMLRVASLLLVLLFTIHIADDIVRGFSPGGLTNMFGILLFVVFLSGPVLLPHRLAGRIIMLLTGVGGIGGALIHFTGRGVGAPGTRTVGAFFFIWTLYAMGTLGGITILLAVNELVLRARRGKQQ